MNNNYELVKQEVDNLYKRIYGNVVTLLFYFSSDIDLQTAEDIVQEAFSTAILQWQSKGIPNNPAGWIYRVSRNRAYNKLRAEKKLTTIIDEGLLTEEYEYTNHVIQDEKLRLLFSCVHPDLPPKVQLVVTLKYVVNLKVEAIANSLAMTIDGIDKLLLRARQKIKEDRSFLQMPDWLHVKDRLPIVHKVIYLLFNEGYKASSGKTAITGELCEEALILCKLLIDSEYGNMETKALYALMLFNSARFSSRQGLTGELLDLESQDRTLWNKQLIAIGVHFLELSKGEETSSYHYQASIAYLHCIASDFKSTDWSTISVLYFKLIEKDPSPFITLNYAIALFYSGEIQRAKQILLELKEHPYLNKYYLLNTALGKIAIAQYKTDEAKEYLNKALLSAPLKAETNYIQKLLDHK
jgi:RNA polymerase sigma factor (sigma-70 family)